MDSDGDSLGDTRRLTYGQIAAMRQISRDSAERTVRRRGWRRQVGNDGLVRVDVPLAWLEAGEADPPDNRPDSPPDKPSVANGMAVALEAVQQAHKAEIEAKDQLIGSLRDQIGQQAEELERTRQERARAEQAIVGERTRADVLRDRLDTETQARRDAEDAANQVRADARAAQDDAAALRQADDARRAQGFLRRVLAAWRGE